MAEQSQKPVAPMAIGGQAVIEGVMMRAPGCVATAVRSPDGTINIRTEQYRALAERYPLLRLPVIRGAVGLIEMMVIGIRTLNYSAEMSLADVSGPDPTPRSSLPLALTITLALLAGIGLFFALPLLLTSTLFSANQEPLRFNALAGTIRVIILLGYLTAIAMMRDVQRLFEYHGAEHKAVFTIELGLPLDVETAALQSRFHPRCGTSFLLVVMLASILLFSMVDAVAMVWLGSLTLALRLAIHLPLIPLVGGLSYELIRISARHSATLPGRMIAAPGLWLQRITTREPDASQLEVALAALRAAAADRYAAPAATATETTAA